MACSDVPTLLPLDRYAAIMGVSLPHFNNLDDGKITSACRPFWTQYAHDEIAFAINQAEEKLRRHLQFDVAPAWREETIQFGAGSASWYSDWRIAPVVPQYGHVIAFGRKAKSLIASDVSVTYTSNYASFYLPVAGITDPSEIHLYYRVADGAAAPGDPAWEIRPIRVVITGTSALVVGDKALFALPSVRESEYPAPYDKPESYVTGVDAYRLYTDPATPVTLFWDAESGADPSADTTQTAAARLIDPVTGQFQVRPAVWDQAKECHIAVDAAKPLPPERLEVCYHAGYALNASRQIDSQFEEAVVRLANTLLPERGIPFCDAATHRYARDRDVVDEQTGMMFGELFAARVAESRKRPSISSWQAV